MVGSNHVWSLEKIYYKYLRELSADVELFPAQNYFYEYYNQSLINKIIYRAGLSGIIDKVNKKLQKHVEHFKPDVVWVFKGMELLPATLQWLKDQHIFLVNYNPDNPFIFSGQGSGNANIGKSIALYDLHFTYNLEVKNRLEKEGHNVFFLPFGFDLSERLYEECCKEKEIIKPCFIGNPDRGRADFINKLAGKGIAIDVYGNQWDKFLRHPKINLFPTVLGDDFWKVLRRYRVQINLMRVHNLNSHNMRSFEIPSVGGIMLAPDTDEHRLFFNDKKEVFLFSDLEQCANLINQILCSEGAIVDSMRQEARQRCLISKYSYADRAVLVLQQLNGALN